MLAVPLAIALAAAPVSSSSAQPESPSEDVAPPAAPSPPSHGLELGAGLGYSLPIGPLGVASEGLGTHISNLETAAVPLSLEAGYLFSGWLFVGGTLSWGPAVAPNNPGPCRGAGVSCFDQDIQALAVARLYFDPRAHTTGWLGVAVGWEAATFATSASGTTRKATYTGPVMADLRLGFEVRSRPIAIAPYLGVAFGEYVTRGVDPASPPVPVWIGTALHEWVTLGIRGTYGPL